MGPARWSLLWVCALLSACQLVGGFEDFTTEGGMTGGSPPGGSGGSGGDGASGSNLGGEAPVTAGTGGNGSACSSTPPETKGATMVRWSRPDDTCFWIDETEVTAAEYQEFLDDSGSTVQEGACAWNQVAAGGATGAGGAGEPASAFEPDASCVADIPGGALDEQGPVSCIDWCDAQAYCQWAGKDLCRDSALSPQSESAAESDWFAACSGNEENAYPYGPNRSAAACNGGDSEHGCDVAPECGAVPGKTYEGCVASQGATEVYDLSGNVAEWTRACSTTGPGGQCNTRGGSFNSLGSTLDCATVAPYARSSTDRKVGFRCCAEPG